MSNFGQFRGKRSSRRSFGSRSSAPERIDPASVELVITPRADEVCPAFLTDVPRMHWPLQDPDRKNEDLDDAARLAHSRVARDQIEGRLEVLAALRDVPEGPDPKEFHASIRVPDLAAGARFYTSLPGLAPKE